MNLEPQPLCLQQRRWALFSLPPPAAAASQVTCLSHIHRFIPDESGLVLLSLELDPISKALGQTFSLVVKVQIDHIHHSSLAIIQPSLVPPSSPSTNSVGSSEMLQIPFEQFPGSLVEILVSVESEGSPPRGLVVYSLLVSDPNGKDPNAGCFSDGPEGFPRLFLEEMRESFLELPEADEDDSRLFVLPRHSSLKFMPSLPRGGTNNLQDNMWLRGRFLSSPSTQADAIVISSHRQAESRTTLYDQLVVVRLGEQLGRKRIADDSEDPLFPHAFEMPLSAHSFVTVENPSNQSVQLVLSSSYVSFAQLSADKALSAPSSADTRVWLFIGLGGLGSTIVFCVTVGVFLWWAHKNWKALH